MPESPEGLSSPQELERRLKRVPPGDTARGYFFQCTLEQVRSTGNPEALRRCLEVSGTETHTAFFKYPITALLRLLYHAAWALKGEGSFEQSLRHLGQHVAQDFLTNAVGKTLLLVAGKNLKLLADALPAAYPTGWDHGKGAVKWVGPRHCVASIHGNAVPYPYFEGIFLTVFQAVGAPHLQVKGRQVAVTETEYEISWG
jgi:uncharacterized protein (TIGR02265 family)